MRAGSDRELSSFWGGHDRTAAWELHVELATRVSGVPLPDGEGLLGEALASLDVLASGCREMLREHRVHLVEGAPCQVIRLAGEIAGTLEALVARWRPRPADREADWADWADAADLRADLARVRAELRPVGERLAELAGAVSLLPPDPDTPDSRNAPGSAVSPV